MPDVETFLKDQFGTPDAIVGLANANGVDMPPKDTVRKWFARGAIPGNWLFTLLYLIERDTGTLPSVTPYFEDERQENDIFG